MKRFAKYALLLTTTLAALWAPAPADAAHHYVWSNRDYRFWVDDRTVETRPDGRWAAVDLIVEDLHRGTFTTGLQAGGKVEFRRDADRWLVTIGDVVKPVDFYAGWWQWNGLRWLQGNGFLADD